jgi:hypothetical protein
VLGGCCRCYPYFIKPALDDWTAPFTALALLEIEEILAVINTVESPSIDSCKLNKVVLNDGI